MADRMTGGTVVVSTIGAALRQRGIGVGELRRRLAQRGIHISRGALDRLASDRPLKAVNFDLLLPILDELGLKLGEPFVAVSNEDLGRQQAARALGREAARNLANGDATTSAVAVLVDEADLADQESIDRLDAMIRSQHPEVFDGRGRLRKRALGTALAKRFGGTRLTSGQVDDVIAAGRAAATRRRGAR